MDMLTSQQRRRLRSLANHLEPTVFVGKRGMTPEVIAAVEENLDAHELIKVRFVELKDQKKALTEAIAAQTHSHVAGIIGHVAILYREHTEPERTRISLD